jgi:cytoskeletal protein CcmA (bactofilin family)
MSDKRFTDSMQAHVQKTYINSTTKIKGEVKGSHELLLDGELDGKIKLKSLLHIGKDGRVKGEVVADNIIVEGKLEGKIEAKNKIEIRSNANSTGNIICRQIAIADGAFFQGNVEMESGKDLEPTFFKEKRGDLKTQGEKK